MLSKDELYNTTEKYFHAFEMKDIECITNMFASDIVLKDPYVKEVKGLNTVLDIYSDIFHNCVSITIEKIAIFVDCFSATAVGEIELYCGITKIEVVDIIEYTSDGKIRKITAYLDRKNDN